VYDENVSAVTLEAPKIAVSPLPGTLPTSQLAALSKSLFCGLGCQVLFATGDFSQTTPARMRGQAQRRREGDHADG
jgi:hypothetical protein